MNGAIAVPPNNMSKPRRSSIINIGNSHHFLLCLRKNQNSTSKGVRFFCASFLNSLDFSRPEFLDIRILQFFRTAENNAQGSQAYSVVTSSCRQ